MKIRVLSRKSDLAIIQAYEFGEYLKSKFPDTQIEYITKSTSGDKDLTTPLSEMPSEGVFTNDLRDELIHNQCDLIVHSWKDLPIEVGKQTIITSTLKRADKRDILFIKKNKINKDGTINILSIAAFATMKPSFSELLINFLKRVGILPLIFSKFIILYFFGR